MYQYSLEKYTAYYWEGGTTYNEAVLPMREKDGVIQPISLMYPIDEVISVCNAELTEEYLPGRDYAVKDGRLVIPEGSRIKVQNYGDLYLEELLPNHSFEGTKGGHVYFSEGDDLHRKQFVVTYTHPATWNGPVPPSQGGSLPRTMHRLKNGMELNVVFFGDSICAGGNSSALLKVPPYAPMWADMVTEHLRKQYPDAKIHMYNEAVGGTDAKWGAEQAESLVCVHKPDLVVLAFGMNDAALQIEPMAYKSYIQSMMNTIRAVSPQCEFLLVSSMRSNVEAKFYQGKKLAVYRAILQQLTREGVVLADMLALHEYLLTKKKFRDMTGNNINHCNDFLARAYAQLIIKTLSEDGALSADRREKKDGKTAETDLQGEIQEKLKAYLAVTPQVKYLPAYNPKSNAVGPNDWSNIRALTFDGACLEGRKTKVFAYIGYPAQNAGRAPAVVLLHGGGGYVYAEWIKKWTDRGYVALAFHHSGYFPTAEGMGLAGRETDPPSYWEYGLAGDFLEEGYTDAPFLSEMIDAGKPPETQWMLHAVAQTILAHNLLLADPRVDPQRIGICGISWGGVITSLTIGYDTRWAFAVPIYGSGYLEEALDYIGPLFNTPESRANWSAQKRFPQVHFPVLWLSGNSDTAFTITSNSKSYLDTRRNDKTVLSLLSQLPHGHSVAWNAAESYRFADWIVQGGAGLATLGSEPSGRRFSFDITVPSDAAEVRATIYYITEKLTYGWKENNTLLAMEQEWKTAPCTVSGHTVAGTVPADAYSYYVEIQAVTPDGAFVTASSFITLD